MSVKTTAYRIAHFSGEEFFASLSNEHFLPHQVAEHKRAVYLLKYLQDPAIAANTIVTENDYTDGDYLDDYTAYYAKCFRPYARRCKRLHFFSLPISEDEFESWILRSLSSERGKALADSYLGFIVARPLPDAIIGRTVLKTYPSNGERRHYSVTRPYQANLFGIDLSIESLAFQEQDTVLAACATVSLWCSFHQTQNLFDTPAPTPAAITRAANQSVRHARPVPSHGLNVQQICSAIQHYGLEPEVLLVKPGTPLLSLLYGYLKMGLPVLLGVRISGVPELHAVTVTGYSLLDAKCIVREVVNPKHHIGSVGLRINELYVHDDQVGPFAKSIIMEEKTGSNCANRILFKGPWFDDKTQTDREFTPTLVIVPVYNKIRVTLIDVWNWVSRFTRAFQSVEGFGENLEWDVHLTTTNEYKKNLPTPCPNALGDLLKDQHPRFLWRALLSQNRSAIVELLVDGTDMARSFPVYKAVWHDKQFKAACKARLHEHAKPLLRILGDPFVRFLDQS